MILLSLVAFALTDSYMYQPDKNNNIPFAELEGKPFNGDSNIAFVMTTMSSPPDDYEKIFHNKSVLTETVEKGTLIMSHQRLVFRHLDFEYFGYYVETTDSDVVFLQFNKYTNKIERVKAPRNCLPTTPICAEWLYTCK
ncbi:hypothetical protein BLNAU_17940 [Blattamonas nauphoetae]|uniref:Uncharacterized protein n=1 Tax=Blattamonas nauphoetae TaxID=2049346 RepID=A0ABQ9X5X6_9EUKA|nr:hypothetical protein BLNAU_17940 [Blattamonas nauphoetae]